MSSIEQFTDIGKFGNWYFVHATGKAFLLKDEDGQEFWIPKSQVPYYKFNPTVEQVGADTCQKVEVMEVADWILKNKGVI